MSRLLAFAVLFVNVAATAQPGRDVLPPQDASISADLPIRLQPVSSPEWRLLLQPAVQKELALSARQKELLRSVEQLPLVPGDVLPWLAGGALSIEVLHEQMPLVRKEFMANVLTREQRVRLKQVAFQLKEREFGAHAAFTMVAKELGLRPDQFDDVKTLRGMRVEEIAKLVTSGERFDKVKPKVATANSDTYEKMAEMLTRAQRERMNQLRGKAFNDQFEADSPANNTQMAPYPRALFGVYDYELTYLRSADVRAELKLDIDTVNKLEDARVDWALKCPNDLERATPPKLLELHQLIESALRLLTKDQRERFDQIALQIRAKVSPEAVCGHPAAIVALKLSPIQLTRLSEGKSINDVLTAEQRQSRLRLLGEPFPILGGFGNPHVPKANTTGRFSLADSFARRFLLVSDRLNLSAEQIKTLREIAEDEPNYLELIQHELSFAAVMPVVGAGRVQSPAAAVSDQFRSAVMEQCWNTLDDKQKSIARQLIGRRR